MGDDCGATSPVIPHPPFHLPSSSQTLLPTGRPAGFSALAEFSPDKKNFQKSKKKKKYFVSTVCSEELVL
jgi:hypothetical protein